MTTVALGVANDGTDGTSPLAYRKILAAQWENPGVIDGLKVTGTSTLAYNVAAGVAVCSKGTADGKTIAYWEGGNTPTVAANSTAYDRYDVIYIYASDLQKGDSDNHVHVGVAQGTASASPATPTIPAYATRLATMKVPAGATAMSGATQVGDRDYAVPYGAARGVVANALVTYNGNWNSTANNTQTWAQILASYKSISSKQFTLPTDRMLQFNVTVTAGANSGQYSGGDGSLYFIMYLDGSVFIARELRIRATGNAVSQFFQVTKEVAAGTHTMNFGYTVNAASSIRMYYEDPRWAGQVVEVVDIGPAM